MAPRCASGGHFDVRRGLLHEVQQLRGDDGWGSWRAYTIRLYSAAEFDRMLTRAGFEACAFHGSLTGHAVPRPASPLVVVASAR